MVDDDRQAAALGLRALAHAVDDVRVDARQVACDQAGIVVARQAHRFTGQKFEGRVAPHVHDGVGLEAVADPVVESQVLVRRRDAGIRVQQFFIDFPAARRLRTDEHIAEREARHQQLAAVDHHLARRRAPAAHAFNAVANQAPIQWRERLARTGFTVVEAGTVAVFERMQVARGLHALRMVDTFDQVQQFLDDRLGLLAARRALALRLGDQHVGMQAAQHAVLHLALHARCERREPARVVGRADAIDGGAHLAQRGAVFGQVHAMRHDHVEQRLGRGG